MITVGDTILICRNLIRKPRNCGMHLCSSQSLCIYDLASGHLDQRRASQKDLGLVLDKDGVVGHGWMICAAGGRRAEDDGAVGLSLGASGGQVSEYLSAFVEYFELLRQENSGLGDKPSVYKSGETWVALAAFLPIGRGQPLEGCFPSQSE